MMKNLKNKKYLMLLFVFLIAFPMGVLSSAYILQKAPIEEMVLQGGVIRLQYSGPSILSNRSHVTVGLKNVEIDKNGNLVVYRDMQETTLISINVTLDEELSKRGITCGVSGGGYKTTILFYNREGKNLNLNDVNDYRQIAGPYSNFFINFVDINTKYVEQFLPTLPEPTPDTQLDAPIENNNETTQTKENLTTQKEDDKNIQENSTSITN